MLLSDWAVAFKDWIPTVGVLAIGAAAVSVLLLFGIREFSLWFFRVHTLEDNQKEIIERLDALSSKLEAAASRPGESQSSEPKFPLQEPKHSPTTNLTLN